MPGVCGALSLGRASAAVRWATWSGWHRAHGRLDRVTSRRLTPDGWPGCAAAGRRRRRPTADPSLTFHGIRPHDAHAHERAPQSPPEVPAASPVHVVAHQGASEDVPEHTLAAYAK